MTTIILAAGLSSRMGRNKLLLPFSGMTIIEKTLYAVLPYSDRVVVVTGHEREKIENILGSYNVDFVYNPGFEGGQRGSTLIGIENVKDDDFSVLPSDLPLLEKSAVATLYSSLEQSSIVRPVYNGIPGHPVCYRKENREKLLHHTGTMKEYLKREGFLALPSPIGCVYDVDTPVRYSALSVFDGDPSILESYID